ncbi:MAG: M23 family metallopeptidase [Bacteroidales bacterium]
MQLKKILLLFCISITSTPLYCQLNTSNKPSFQSPVDFPIYLAGNFGEIRAEHFHAGIDIKTQGVEGKKIYSVDDGYISRIKITANGYGKTLYVDHPNGYTSVYGHLSTFTSEINSLIKNLQYQNKKFEIDYFPKADELKVKKGDLIAFSGNTGQSSGPHLHFEIRDSRNQNPLNPLLFNFPITDNIAPVFNSFIIYPTSKNSLINGIHQPGFYNLIKENGDYRIADTLKLSGKFYFGYEIYDFLNGSKNRCGIYTLSVLINNEEVYYHLIDNIAFSEMGYVKSHIDYSEKIRTKKTVQTTYIAPNNNLSIYKKRNNQGIFDFSSDSIFNIQLIATDVHGNKSNISFIVRGTSITNNQTTDYHANTTPYDWNVENRFSTENIQLIFPAKIFFDTLSFTYATADPMENSYSLVHKIHNKYTPILKSYSASIKTINLPAELTEKALIVQKNGNDKIVAFGGDYINGYITTPLKEFGDYYVLVDTLAPLTTPILKEKNIIHPDSTIRFTIKDDLSGIKTYNGYIDNNWALFEYDQKNDLLFYILDGQRINRNTNHELELFVIDKKENISTYYTTFYW